MKKIFQKQVKVDITIGEKEQAIIEEIMNKVFIENKNSGLFFYIFISRFGEKIYGSASGYKVGNEFNLAVEDAVIQYKSELCKSYLEEQNKRVQPDE